MGILWGHSEYGNDAAKQEGVNTYFGSHNGDDVDESDDEDQDAASEAGASDISSQSGLGNEVQER